MLCLLLNLQGGTPSLKKLAQEILGINIQEREHNSVSMWSELRYIGGSWLAEVHSCGPLNDGSTLLSGGGCSCCDETVPATQEIMGRNFESQN